MTLSPVYLIDLLDPATALTVGIALLVLLLVPFLIWEMRHGKMRGHSRWNWRKPRGHSDVGDDLGDRRANPYSRDAQARR